MKLYKNTMNGKIKSYKGWKKWAEEFYTSLEYDEMGRDVSLVKHIDVLLPKDWWERTKKTLRLEEVKEY